MQENKVEQSPDPNPGEERTSEEVASGGTDSGIEATVPEDESGVGSGAGEIQEESSRDTIPSQEETGTGRTPGGAELGPNPGRSGAGT